MTTTNLKSERARVYARIDAERDRQDKKWRVQTHGPLYWHAILSEEIGELAKAIIEGKNDEAHVELVQVAAVAVAWLELIESLRPDEDSR